VPPRLVIDVGEHTLGLLGSLGEAPESTPTFPRLTIRTFVESDGYQFEVTFADTSLQEAIQVLKKRGCAPLPINGSAPIELAPASTAPHQRKNNDDGYWTPPDDDGYYAAPTRGRAPRRR
jgi:hypothetical protein